MGIDIFGLNLLRFAAGTKELGRVATIGRQGLHIPDWRLKELLNLQEAKSFGPYCEKLLESYFCTPLVHSYDNSSYEGATHVVDMNKPLHAELKYDTIIDGGCLEHIYNVPQALHNLSEMCANGGQILHILPANNFCGHGFWQFSPELFFSLYSNVNGYSDTRVFLVDLSNEYFWFEVIKPASGDRVNVFSCTPLYLLVRTIKMGAFSHEEVQQSDYAHAWKVGPAPSVSVTGSQFVKSKLKRWIKNSKFRQIAALVNRQTKKLPAWMGLAQDNPNIKRHLVSDLLTHL